MYYRGENNEIIEAYGSRDVDPSKKDCTPTWLIILLIIILIIVIAFVVYSIIKNKKY